MLKKIMIAMSCCMVAFFSTVDAMHHIIIKNESTKDIYMDDCRTTHSFVANEEKFLEGSAIAVGEEKSLDMRFTAPDCNPEENYVCLSIFDGRDEEYKPILIRWGTCGIYSDKDQEAGLYRLNEDVSGNSVIFEIFDDSEEVVEKLTKKTKAKLDMNRSSQQSVSERDIIRCSGVSDQNCWQK